MKKVKLAVSRKPGKISIDNFDEVKEYVTESLEPYENKNYGKDATRAKYDKRMLSKLKKELEDGIKEAVSVYTEPLEKFKFSFLKLTSSIEGAIAKADDHIASLGEREKKSGLEAIKKFFDANSAILGTYAECVFESRAFIEEKWLSSPPPSVGTQNAILDKIVGAAADISTIETTCLSLAPVMLAKYFEELDMNETIKFRESVVRAANGSMRTLVHMPDEENGGGEIVLNCGEDNFLRVLDQLRLMDIDHYVKSSTYPSVLHEIKKPNFDSFVALDIETTGSLGAASGDGPAEITEIGAVKVENGVIVDRFSSLANPGRRITPHVARLTHITDEMVADKPSVDEVIRSFFEFAGDNILVGHGIKGSDLPFICRACRRAGVAFNNEYFDTCEYAAQLKEKYGWQKIKLEYLSELFGVGQNEAHRAWCDAQANVGVYFALKALK